MGRKEERLGQALEVKIPTYFRCPISLDVMRSPVSLCTGITYDRASIQRWLDSGNTTCPATMLPLPSTDLVPNLTLQRLIRLWSSAPSAAAATAAAVVGAPASRDLLRDLSSCSAAGGDPVPTLRKLAEFFDDDDVDEFEKNNVVNAGGCASIVVSILHSDVRSEALEAAIRVLVVILTLDAIEESNKKIAVSEIISDVKRSVSALTRVLRGGSSLEARIYAARVLGWIIDAANPESKVRIAEEEELVRELIRLIGQSDEKGAAADRRAVEEGLACLLGISGTRRVIPTMVRAGLVAALTRVLRAEAAVGAERALRLMEAASGCAEGRAAICEEGAAAAEAVAGRMVKAGGREGAEAAAAVLWRVCHRFRDRRAVEAVESAEGVVTKLLLVMQSGCSTATKLMAADLLKIFQVSSKSCLAGYDTKTTHIMPF